MRKHAQWLVIVVALVLIIGAPARYCNAQLPADSSSPRVPDLNAVMQSEITSANGPSNFDKVTAAYERMREEGRFIENSEGVETHVESDQIITPQSDKITTPDGQEVDITDKEAEPDEIDAIEKQIEDNSHPPEYYNNAPDEENDLPSKSDSGDEGTTDQQGHGGQTDNGEGGNTSGGEGDGGGDEGGGDGMALARAISVMLLAHVYSSSPGFSAGIRGATKTPSRLL